MRSFRIGVESFLRGYFQQKGIWISNSRQDVSTKFSTEEQDVLYALEDNSWWFRYRFVVISVFAEKFFSKKQLILDVGGG